MASLELEEILKPLIANPHVLGVLVANKEGSVIKTTLDAVITKLYADKLTKYLEMTQKMIQEIDEPDAPQKNELTFLRIRSKKHEIMISPDVTEHKYMLMVLQNPERKTESGKDRI
ncbi:9426_t:CDS:2 [Ambispora gerdemannii]|uniref:9426_t:CDS:1 n=1 Tax=Ambispora gerdemannii TaxID=144530 RepID=A0A9N8W230_9GLOM|nr:9426_t:CDS:2 [Ambispora gerdemannii]